MTSEANERMKRNDNDDDDDEAYPRTGKMAGGVLLRPVLRMGGGDG